MRTLSAITVTMLAFAASLAHAQTLPVGTLASDGPATPEQIALHLPVTGSLANSATATVRYRLVGSTNWTDGHPMFRVRPNFSTTPAVGNVTGDFAWTIVGLEPGRSYEVEVIVGDGGSSETRTTTFTTRSLPPAAGPADVTIAAGSTTGQIQSALDGLQPGDVLEFENGQYNISTVEFRRSGTSANPIYVRGASRDNVVLNSSARPIFLIRNASHLIIENMTIQGTGSDGAIGNLQRGITSYGVGSTQGSARNTIRNVTMTGVDSAITFYEEVSEALVYDNTIIGNNIWNAAFHGDNRTWDDDGINLPGFGNVAFNNTIRGFGDTFSYAQHAGNGTLTETRGVHFYRNDIRNSLDDVVEVDHAQRNVSFYDNRAHNVATCTSLDPLYGGPWLYARNVCINPARVNLHKWNDTNSGQFIYSNTFIIKQTAAGGDPDVSAWYQPNNGAQEAYGYRNNVHVYTGGGNTLWLESGGHSVVDWTHNSWFPDRQIQWDFSAYSNLANAQSGLRNSTPMFSGSTRRMANDNVTTANPWTTTINLTGNSLNEVTASYEPVLANGTAPRSSGVVIPNITDGFSGAAPDRGALMNGRSVPSWGDQNSTPPPVAVAPNPPLNLVAN